MHFEIFISKNLSSATAVCGVHPYLLVVKSFFKILFYLNFSTVIRYSFATSSLLMRFMFVDDTIF